MTLSCLPNKEILMNKINSNTQTLDFTKSSDCALNNALVFGLQLNGQDRPICNYQNIKKLEIPPPSLINTLLIGETVLRDSIYETELSRERAILRITAAAEDTAAASGAAEHDGTIANPKYVYAEEIYKSSIDYFKCINK